MKRIQVKKLRRQELRRRAFIKADLAIKAGMVFTISGLLLVSVFSITTARVNKKALENYIEKNKTLQNENVELKGEIVELKNKIVIYEKDIDTLSTTKMLEGDK